MIVGKLLTVVDGTALVHVAQLVYQWHDGRVGDFLLQSISVAVEHELENAAQVLVAGGRA